MPSGFCGVGGYGTTISKSIPKQKKIEWMKTPHSIHFRYGLSNGDSLPQGVYKVSMRDHHGYDHQYC